MQESNVKAEILPTLLEVDQKSGDSYQLTGQDDEQSFRDVGEVFYQELLDFNSLDDLEMKLVSETSSYRGDDSSIETHSLSELGDGMSSYRVDNQSLFSEVEEDFYRDQSPNDSRKECSNQSPIKRESLRAQPSEQLKEAVGYLDQGFSLSGASQMVGRHKSWLSHSKGRNKEGLVLTFEAYCQENELSDEQRDYLWAKLFNQEEFDKIRAVAEFKQAIDYLDQGYSFKRASEEVGRTHGWLYYNRVNISQGLVLALDEYCLEKGLSNSESEGLWGKLFEINRPNQQDRLIERLKQAIDHVDQGSSLTEASILVGRNPSWMSNSKINSHDSFILAFESYCLENQLMDAQLQELQDKLFNKGMVTNRSRLVERFRQAIGYIHQGDNLEKASLKVGRSHSWLSGSKVNNGQTLRTVCEDYCRENQVSTHSKERIFRTLFSGGERLNGNELINHLKQAIGYVVNGDSFASASLSLGRNTNWFSGHKVQNNRKVMTAFEAYCQENQLSSDQRQRLYNRLIHNRQLRQLNKAQLVADLKQAVGYVSEGHTLASASLKTGKSKSWLSGHRFKRSEGLLLALRQYCQENQLSERERIKIESRLIH